MYEIETEGFYRDNVKDVQAKFDTSGYLKDHKGPSPTGRKKKVIDMMEDEFSGKITAEFVALRGNVYPHRKRDCLATQYEHKRLGDKCCNGTKKCAVTKSLTYAMTIGPACLRVKQCTGSKCCLKARNTWCTW